MPLGVVSDEEFEAEACNIIAQNITAQHKDITRGRGNTSEVPEVIREIIAEDAIASDLTGEEIAEKYGVSESSVSAYKHGATSTKTYHEGNERLLKQNDLVRENIICNARSRLLSALQHITPEKLADAKLRDVASVAKDMSSIINNMSPELSNIGNRAQFIFHVPVVKKESDFDIIDVTSSH